MHLGILFLGTDLSMSVVEVGRAAEAAGFESLFLGEHTHIPVGAEMTAAFGDQQAHLLDPFVALSAVAAVTTSLRLGTGVCLVIERDPITLAKEVASLDYLSGGRFLFGVGGGWNQPEMQNHGTDPALRWKILRERIQAMKRIWTAEQAEYHGNFVDFNPIWSWPKPIQQPHPPILIGGNGPHAFQRILEYGDGWMPFVGYSLPDGEWQAAPGGLATFLDGAQELQRLAAEAGRGPLSVTCFGAPPDRVALEQLQTAGVDRCCFLLPPGPAATVLPVLERCAAVAAGLA